MDKKNLMKVGLLAMTLSVGMAGLSRGECNENADNGSATGNCGEMYVPRSSGGSGGSGDLGGSFNGSANYSTTVYACAPDSKNPLCNLPNAPTPPVPCDLQPGGCGNHYSGSGSGNSGGSGGSAITA